MPKNLNENQKSIKQSPYCFIVRGFLQEVWFGLSRVCVCHAVCTFVSQQRVVSRVHVTES